MLTLKTLQERVANSDYGREWINDPLMNQDIWELTELGYSSIECRINARYKLHLDDFSLPWLKYLSKLTIRATARARFSIGRITHRVCDLKCLDKFLKENCCTSPQLISESLLHQFIASSSSVSRQNTITYATNLWKEEQWLDIPFTPRRLKKNTPKIEVIPEEVLYQVYEKFDLLPAQEERLFRLQLVLGCRIGEIITMPRQCLKNEGSQWFLLRWIEKRKHWRFYQIHPLVAELIQEQQRFLNTTFGSDSDFDKLFCTAYLSKKKNTNLAHKFQIPPIYRPKVISRQKILQWLNDFSNLIDLKDKYGNKFKLTSHMFRRTKASIMAYCEAEDEYIAAVLGHSSLDMLPHYRKRSIERLEKESSRLGYVDMYGRITSFKPRKRRYERLAELLKVSTPLGECHRPTMLGDCQYRYACLSCDHHRVTPEDKPKLEADIQRLQEDLVQAQAIKADRRVTEIERILKLLQNRMKGLEELIERTEIPKNKISNNTATSK
ncbi:MAG: tyrosine-type recombinase/integrase [Cyanobacteria bacterium J06621_15]